MSKKISSLITAAVVAIFMLMSSFTTVYADNYKNWLQSDSRWSGKTLGGSGETMREIGCAVISVAIQVVHSGSKSESNFNPGTLVDYLNKSGGLDSGGNLYWGAVTGLVSSFTFEKRAYFASQTKTNIIKELTNYINSGYYVVMSVDYDCHWVAIDTISNGVVYMMDPAQNKTNKLFDYYNVGGMLQVRLFKGKNAPAKVNSGSNATPGTTAPSTTEPQVTTTNNASGNIYLTGHYLTTDPLNLRESYSTSSDVLLTIPENSTIVVTRIYNNSWGETEYDGESGWVYMGYTKYTEGEYTYAAGTYKCTSDNGVNMRSGVGTDKSVVCLVPYKATVTISSVSHNWGKATYGSYTGYICMDYLEYVPDSSATTTTTKATTTTTTTKATTTTTTTKATTTTTTTKATTTTTTTKATTTTTTTKATTTTTTTKATTTTTTTKATTTTTTTKATTTTTTTQATTTTTTTKATTAAATTTTTAAVSETAPQQTTTASTSVSAVTTPASTTVIKGDINRDGKLDKDDVLKLNLYIIKPVKLDILTTYIYDMNNDGIINEIDVIYLMKEIKKRLYSNAVK